MKTELSIVIPVYNEADNIKKTLAGIKTNVRSSHEIIVVYDFDDDTTLPVLRRLNKTYKNLSIKKNTIAKGPSGAIRTGLMNARSKKILVMMADLCDDITQVDNLVALMTKKADIVCPSRYSKGGEQQLKSPLKVWIPRTAGFLLKLLTNIPTSDPTNSFKLYSRKMLQQMPLKSTISFSVTLEIVAKAHCLGYKIVEIPTIWKDRQYGKTNFKLGQSLVGYMPWFLLALLKNRFFSLPKYQMKNMIIN